MEFLPTSEGALWIAVTGQALILVFLALRKFIEWAFHKKKSDFDDEREARKEERIKHDKMMELLLEIAPIVRSTKAELDLYREYIMSIPKLRNDVAFAFRWLKEGRDPRQEVGVVGVEKP